MFAVYCIILASCVFFAPALALFPKLILHPRLFALSPIVSALLVYCVSSLFIEFNIYNQTNILVLTANILIIACIRVSSQVQSCKHYWSRQAFGYYFLHAVILLPFFVKLATHGFDRGDEIYSWNFWAIQHYLSIPLDTSHTGAAYPQLLPKLLSYCYQILGDLQLQLPIKSMLILFPYMMLNGLASLIPFSNKRNITLYAVGLLFVLFGCNIAQFFDDAYADPIMTSAVALSLVCLWQYHRWLTMMNRNPESQKKHMDIANGYLFFSTLTAVAAFLSKQPGLLWVLALILVTLHTMFCLKHKAIRLVAPPILLILFSLFCVWLWLQTEGHQFHQNDGVIWLSKGDRGYFSQLGHSIYRYLILKPSLLLLFVLSFIAARNNAFLRKATILFFVPGVILWFLFGAYQLRLGQQYIVFAWFVLLASHFSFKVKPFLSRLPNIEKPLVAVGSRFIAYPKAISYCLLLSSVIISYVLWYRVSHLEQPGVSLYEGRRVSLTRYFGKDADWIYQNIFLKEHVTIWVPSRYLYGLFYPNTNLVTPDYEFYRQYNQDALLDELIRKKPDYVFEVSEAVIDGPASAQLTILIKNYPQAFEKVSDAPNRFDFVTYKVDSERLLELI